MTPEEVFECADEITLETRYRIQLAREELQTGFEAGRQSAFEEMARMGARRENRHRAREERRCRPGRRAHFTGPPKDPRS
jgi:hypothetical protein